MSSWNRATVLIKRSHALKPFLPMLNSGTELASIALHPWSAWALTMFKIKNKWLLIPPYLPHPCLNVGSVSCCYFMASAQVLLGSLVAMLVAVELIAITRQWFEFAGACSRWIYLPSASSSKRPLPFLTLTPTSPLSGPHRHKALSTQLAMVRTCATISKSQPVGLQGWWRGLNDNRVGLKSTLAVLVTAVVCSDDSDNACTLNFNTEYRQGVRLLNGRSARQCDTNDWIPSMWI